MRLLTRLSRCSPDVYRITRLSSICYQRFLFVLNAFPRLRFDSHVGFTQETVLIKRIDQRGDVSDRS